MGRLPGAKSPSPASPGPINSTVPPFTDGGMKCWRPTTGLPTAGRPRAPLRLNDISDLRWSAPPRPHFHFPLLPTDDLRPMSGPARALRPRAPGGGPLGADRCLGSSRAQRAPTWPTALVSGWAATTANAARTGRARIDQAIGSRVPFRAVQRRPLPTIRQPQVNRLDLRFQSLTVGLTSPPPPPPSIARQRVPVQREFQLGPAGANLRPGCELQPLTSYFLCRQRIAIPWCGSPSPASGKSSPAGRDSPPTPVPGGAIPALKIYPHTPSPGRRLPPDGAVRRDATGVCE